MKNALLRHLIVLLFAQTAMAAGAAEDAGAWNVNEPGYSVSASTVEINVTEGTWMSLTVSPDGEHIAFDLLGDLYEIPMAGGTARVLTEGHAWDIQPRYSPDGRSIAFVSDRAGGDNLWVMDRETLSVRQVSFEKFRLLNNPTWSPDSRYLAARKHFTTSRSLGTGEIWMYHVASAKESSAGVQVVKRPSPSFQKELGEPAFSADGSGIFYTQNVTPGNMFIYHQDTNKEVFQIKRVDLATGETSTAAGGPGGAVRPSPSPDGRHLAFVKRVRGDSSLFVKDLSTGIETRLVSGLDTDLQETWAVYGVYPNTEWTPDSRAIVYWSGGGIHRVDVATNEVTKIPFEINHARAFYPAPVPTTEVAPASFPTRMVRFASRSPDGEAIVFESLGHLYIKEGDREPRRLTRNEAGFE